MTCIRGSMNAQVLDKTLRLTAQDSQCTTASSVIKTDIEELLAGIPGMFEIVASPVELSAGISSLWQYLGGALFAVLLPSICENPLIFTRNLF